MDETSSTWISSDVRTNRRILRLQLCARNRAGTRQLVIPELLPQLGLEELPRRRVRQLLDEDDVVGHPPLRHLARVEPEQVLARDARARLPDRDHEGPLVPFRVAHADDRGFSDRWMRHGDVLQVDRADPFAARLDHVLRAIGNLHVAFRVDRSDVARGKPSVAQGAAARALEVFLEYPGAAHQQIAEGLAVARQLLALAVDDLHFDAVEIGRASCRERGYV